MYYANNESDDVMRFPTKMIKYWIKNISRNIKAVFLAAEMFIINETKWYMLCCCHDNGFTTGPVLIKTEIPKSLVLTKDH